VGAPTCREEGQLFVETAQLITSKTRVGNDVNVDFSIPCDQSFKTEGIARGEGGQDLSAEGCESVVGWRFDSLNKETPGKLYHHFWSGPLDTLIPSQGHIVFEAAVPHR